MEDTIAIYFVLQPAKQMADFLSWSFRCNTFNILIFVRSPLKQCVF